MTVPVSNLMLSYTHKQKLKRLLNAKLYTTVICISLFHSTRKFKGKIYFGSKNMKYLEINLRIIKVPRRTYPLI